MEAYRGNRPVTVVAMPVYTPKDYPVIRGLPGADDLPLTWDEWREHFEAYLKKRGWGHGHSYVRVRIRPDLFKAWLDANSQVASERSRQRYAQELRDARSARNEAHTEEKRPREIEGRLMPATSGWRAIPVYTPHDYPPILELSATGDLPATWDEWWENFKASESEQRRQGMSVTRVRVHAGKFKAWLQANSLMSTEQTRQQYAQRCLDMKRARRAARRAAEPGPIGGWPRIPEPPPPPSPWPHSVIEVLAYVVLAVAIGSVLLALKDGWSGWVMRELPTWPLNI